MSTPQTTWSHFGDAFRDFHERSNITLEMMECLTDIRLGTLKKWRQGLVSTPRYWQEIVLAAHAMTLNEDETNILLNLGGKPRLKQLISLSANEKVQAAILGIYGKDKDSPTTAEQEGLIPAADPSLDQATDRLVAAVERRLANRFPLFVDVPFPPTHFVGRTALVDKLAERLFATTNLALASSNPSGVLKDRLAVEGLPGIGKTTLAVVLARDSRVRQHFSDGILWGALGRAGNVTRVLNRWADALGCDLTQHATDIERAQVISTAIGQRRVLLVIDDAWDVKAANILRCGGPNCCHLLTTRDLAIAREFAGLPQLETVPPLDDAASWQLLEALAPEVCHAAPDAVQKLVHAAGGLPLTLALLGGLLAAPEHSLFEELAVETATQLEELADPLSPMSRLNLAMQRLGALTDRELTLAETIALSLEVLPAETQRVFRDLGAFAPKPERFGRKDAEIITYTNTRTLTVLVARNLVERISDTELSLHQTLADAARAQTTPDALTRHRAYYLARATENRSNWQKIEPLYGQAAWAWRTAPRDDSLLRFLNALGPYQALRGLWQEQGVWVEQTLQLADEQTWDTTLRAALVALQGLAEEHRGLWREAATSFEQVLHLAESDDLHERALAMDAFTNLGNVYAKAGRDDFALDMHQASLQLAQELGNEPAQSNARNNLGIVYRNQGRIAEALACFQVNLEAATRVDDALAAARAMSQLGKLFFDQAPFADSYQLFTHCLQVAQDFGDVDLEATTYTDLGELFYTQERLDEALAFYEQSLQLTLKLHDSRQEAQNRLNLARIYLAQDNYAQAEAMAQHSRQLAQQLADRKLEAKSLMLLGIVAQCTGAASTAITHHEAALQVADTLPNQSLKGQILSSLASVYEVQERWEDALYVYNTRLALARTLGETGVEQQCLAQMGAIYLILGDIYQYAVVSRQLYGLLDPSQPSEQLLRQNFEATLQQFKQHYQAELEAAQAAGETKNEGIALFQLGLMQWIVADDVNARQFMQEAMQTLSTDSKTYFQAMSVLNTLSTGTQRH